jgi:hypothetical protein
MVTKLKAVAGLLVVLIAVVAPATVADATMVLNAVSATTANFAMLDTPITQAINQSGLSDTYTSGVDDFDAYIGGSPTHDNNPAAGNTTDFLGDAASQAAVPTLEITFNLGSPYYVEAIAFWSYGQAAQPALRTIDIQASEDASFSSPVSLGTFTPFFSSNFNFQPVQVYDTFSTTIAQYIRFVNMNNDPASSSAAIAFGEVAFGVTAVPEARAWLVMGVVAVGAVCAFSVRKLLRRNGTPQPLVLSQL